MIKNKVVLCAVALCFATFCGCAGSKNGLPPKINFSNSRPASEAMHAEEFRVMDSLSYIGQVLAWQDGVAWVASDSLSRDVPEKDFPRKGKGGWVAQGNLRDGFCIFYGKDSTGYYQIARYDFSPDGMTRAIARTELPAGEIYDLVRMNDSAYNVFLKSGYAYDISYNTYILEKDGQYTFYAMPGSTSEYVVLGGAVKLTSTDSTWKVDLLHKSPIAMKWESIQGNTPVRTSSMGDLLNEADFAQYYIYEKAMPNQYIKTNKYLIGLIHDKSGKMGMVVVE